MNFYNPSIHIPNEFPIKLKTERVLNLQTFHKPKRCW